MRYSRRGNSRKKKIIKAYNVKRTGDITVQIPAGEFTKVGKILRGRGYVVRGVVPKDEAVAAKGAVVRVEHGKTNKAPRAQRQSGIAQKRVEKYGGGKNNTPGSKKRKNNNSD